MAQDNQSILEKQKDMETKLLYSLKRNTILNPSGVIPLMKPEFVDCNYEEKTFTLAFQVEEWELNPEMSMHGGLITTAFDTTFGLMTHYFAQNHFVSTVTIAVTFLKPILLHDKLHITVKATSKGRTLVSLTGEGYLERDNILAATSTATFMILNKEFNT